MLTAAAGSEQKGEDFKSSSCGSCRILSISYLRCDMMTLLFSKQCILPSFRSKGRKLQLCGQGRGETPNQGAGCSRAAMAEDADEEMPVIELGTGRRGLSMEAGRAHQEEDSDDEPIAGSGHRELEFQTKYWFACLRKRIRARSALHACLRAHPRAACMPTRPCALCAVLHARTCDLQEHFLIVAGLY